MAENVFSRYGGKVRYTPDRVQSDITTPYEYTDEDQVRNLGLQRDLTAANLLENDILLDMLDAAIDEQMKDFALTVPELAEAASSLCGSITVTWECYKKAKELLRIAPWIAYGYDPVQLTFTDKFIKRKGNVVFDCKNFDPDRFQTIQNLDADIDATLGTDSDVNTETPSEIEKKARENQKKWALLVLFWDLLWGKPEVKPGIPDDDARKQSIDAINEDIQKLRVQSFDISLVGKEPKYTTAQRKEFGLQADALARGLAKSESMPNTIMLDRPKIVSQLQWQGRTGILPYNLKAINGIQSYEIKKDPAAIPTEPWNENACAVWVDFRSFFTATDNYKDKSIPAIKSGFILSILVGFLGLVPKTVFYFIKARVEFLGLIKWMKVKKYPLVGRIFKPIYTALKFIIDIITAIPVAISTIFLEICIWLAMLPKHHIPNMSDIEEIYISDTGLKQDMEVEPTPAGFISMDCFENAQAILNRVNQEAVN
ncbi:MAG TPA: hypothetical protein VI911_10990 [Patescibacteria group bacterium]|nr:hypothetical protein [Patescibacteria group bacterium]